MIKKGAMENVVEKKGFQPRGSEKIMDILYTTWLDNKLKLCGGSREGFTHLGVVPLSNPEVPAEVKERLNPEDIALCVAFLGHDIDEFRRDGTFRGVLIMSKKDADLFIEAVRNNPELVYEAVRKVNNGHIERIDQKPAEIKPGEKVKISTISADGELEEPIESRPFKENFQPNPLF